ncbi:MAG: hypothetical protein HQ581_27175 [Planctomycetes bacterium]|nr:hypothetical protein [Planctomycetota bacterium]
MLRSASLAMLGLFVVGVTAVCGADLPLVFEDDFGKGAAAWQPTDAAAWRIAEADGNKVYNQFQNSKYKPPHRSPFNISLVKDVSVGDFVLTVKVQSTNRNAGAHRDMCLFFNYQDPAHFYYVHLGHRPDPNSSQIMIVNDKPRVMITKNKSPGIPWDDDWHQVKIVRKTGDGTIEIYFDDMDKPVMQAVDKTFTWGQVGLGSFDDNGNWDDFQLRGVKASGK